MRDGEEIVVNSTEVVRGDVVVLATGDIVPADCRLITADELKVNEMCLTGEADDVNKTADVPTHLLHRAGDAISPNSEKFEERFLNQGPYDFRDIFTSLDIAWTLL